MWWLFGSRKKKKNRVKKSIFNSVVSVGWNGLFDVRYNQGD
jgi:hypothetical protein